MYNAIIVDGFASREDFPKTVLLPITIILTDTSQILFYEYCSTC